MCTTTTTIRVGYPGTPAPSCHHRDDVDDAYPRTPRETANRPFRLSLITAYFTRRLNLTIKSPLFTLLINKFHIFILRRRRILPTRFRGLSRWATETLEMGMETLLNLKKKRKYASRLHHYDDALRCAFCKRRKELNVFDDRGMPSI